MPIQNKEVPKYIKRETAAGSFEVLRDIFSLSYIVWLLLCIITTMILLQTISSSSSRSRSRSRSSSRSSSSSSK